jgi:hypothetical protein
MELSSAPWWDEFDDEFPCLAREECVGRLLRDPAAPILPADLSEGDDD